MKKHIEHIIRPATLQDAQAITQVHCASWQKAYKDYIPESLLLNLPLQARVELWLQAIDNNLVYVLEVADVIVGFVRVIADSVKKHAEIDAIYVHPQYWHKGLGTKLCDYVLPKLQQEGYTQVGIWVLEGNTQARTFYESIGFSTDNTSKLQAFYENGPLLSELCYKKFL